MVFTYLGYEIYQSSRPGFYVKIGSDGMVYLHVNTIEDAHRIINIFEKE